MMIFSVVFIVMWMLSSLCFHWFCLILCLLFMCGFGTGMFAPFHCFVRSYYSFVCFLGTDEGFEERMDRKIEERMQQIEKRVRLSTPGKGNCVFVC